MEQRRDQVAIINGLLDFVFLSIRDNAKKLKNYKVVPVPDLVKKLQFNLLVTSLTASLTATRGTLSDLTTIKRVGDVTLTSSGDTLFVSAPIALDFLEIAFHHYTLQFAMIRKSGDKLKLNVKKSHFDAFICIRFNGLECEIYFDKFSMLQFKEIDVEITGFSFLNPIARKIAEWIVDYFNNFIIKEIAEEYTRNLLNLAMSDKQALQKLFSHAITGVVSETSQRVDANQTLEAGESLQLRVTEAQPMAPLRQRRNLSSTNTVAERQNNHQLCDTSTTSPQHSPTSNNRQTHTSVPQNGSAIPRPLRGTLRNNLSGRKNEIYIQPNKRFSSKTASVVDVNHIPIKPPIL